MYNKTVMHYVYILKCNDGSLYTGYTNDLDKRLLDHKDGKGSKYVRSRLPFKLIYSENFKSKSEAMKREYEIKKWSKGRKIQLVNL